MPVPCSFCGQNAAMYEIGGLCVECKRADVWHEREVKDAPEPDAYMLRSEALDRAVKVMGHTGEPVLVLRAARSFLAFLKNGDDPNDAAVEEVKSW